MNFAFPALFIFLLALPGLILRYTYSKGFFRTRSPVSFRPIPDEIGYSIVFAIVLHFCWYWFWTSCGYYIDLTSGLVFLTGSYGNDDQYLSRALESFSRFPLQVTMYFLSLYAFCVLAGYSLHKFVRGLHWDWKWETFRFRNEWWYLLTGEALQLKFRDKTRALEEAIPKDAQIDTYVAAVVEHGKDIIYVYKGLVYDFNFDAMGNLDRIFLVSAQRRQLNADKRRGKKPIAPGKDDPRFYSITGDRFVLRYSEMKTINLEYYISEAMDKEPMAEGLVRSLSTQALTQTPNKSIKKR